MRIAQPFLFAIVATLCTFSMCFDALGQEATIEQLQERADSGDAEAQYQLGAMYGNADGVERDFEKAFPFFSAAAEQNHPGGQNGVGNCYLHGLGVEQDFEKAIQYLKLAAEQGFAKSQITLADCHNFGIGVPQDYAEAVKWFRLAADQGDAGAQYSLGVMYHDGLGVPQDYAQAMNWFRLSADQGEAMAQYNLGVMYYNGEGVTQSYAGAMKWFRLAAVQGDAEAQYNLGVMYGNGEGVTQSYAGAMKWFRLAAVQGYAEAQYNLGVMYGKGEGVPQDYAEAVKWFRLAADQGDADAITALSKAENLIDSPMGIETHGSNTMLDPSTVMESAPDIVETVLKITKWVGIFLIALFAAFLKVRKQKKGNIEVTVQQDCIREGAKIFGSIIVSPKKTIHANKITLTLMAGHSGELEGGKVYKQAAQELNLDENFPLIWYREYVVCKDRKFSAGKPETIKFNLTSPNDSKLKEIDALSQQSGRGPCEWRVETKLHTKGLNLTSAIPLIREG